MATRLEIAFFVLLAVGSPCTVNGRGGRDAPVAAERERNAGLVAGRYGNIVCRKRSVSDFTQGKRLSYIFGIIAIHSRELGRAASGWSASTAITGTRRPNGHRGKQAFHGAERAWNDALRRLPNSAIRRSFGRRPKDRHAVVSRKGRPENSALRHRRGGVQGKVGKR